MAAAILHLPVRRWVLYDDPADGGDGTYLADAEETADDLWQHGLGNARLMGAEEVSNALEECDQGHLLRHRLRPVAVDVQGVCVRIAKPRDS